MDVVRGTDSVGENLRGGVLALGNFDGVHLGHREVLRLTRTEAAKAGGPSGVVFFDPHPRRFFQPGTPYFRLTQQPMKLKLLEELGLDVAFILPFDKTLAATSADRFMTDILKARLGAAGVVVGWNFRFGNGRKGSAAMLEVRGPEIGFGVHVLQPSVDGQGEPVSATRIRNLLGAGRPRDAAALLGYRWQVTGPVLNSSTAKNAGGLWVFPPPIWHWRKALTLQMAVMLFVVLSTAGPMTAPPIWARARFLAANAKSLKLTCLILTVIYTART